MERYFYYFYEEMPLDRNSQLLSFDGRNTLPLETYIYLALRKLIIWALTAYNRIREQRTTYLPAAVTHSEILTKDKTEKNMVRCATVKA